MESRILIVDDEKMVSSVLARRLSKEGHECITAQNGREALRYFYQDNLSLIISDVRMPEMSGLDLLKNVKAVRPNMMVIIMTAYPEVDMAVEAVRLGVNDIILKPVDFELLIFSVRKALEQRKMEEELESYHKHLKKLVEKRTAMFQRALLALEKTHLDSVKTLAGAIDAKDPYTRGHSDRVRRMCMRIGLKLGFDKKRLEGLVFGAILHDIGKIGIRDEVLQKQGPLDADEYRYIQEHPLIGVKIVEGIDFFKDKLPMIRNHHEHFDGGGYPDRLVGEAIPLEARIIGVPDAFDAMTSSRPHRKAMPLDAVLGEMERGRGKQFDPLVLEIFLKDKMWAA